MSESLTFVVKFATGQCVSISLPKTATVADVKAKLCADNDDQDVTEEEKKAGTVTKTRQDPDAATLYLKEKPLKDSSTLEESGVEEETVVLFKWTGGIKLSAQCELAAVSYDDAREKFAVMVSLKAPMIMDVQRVPIDLCLVVDRSGSMSGLMHLVVETIVFMIKQLQKGDRLSIVEYDNVVATCLGLTSMDESGKRRAEQAARTLTARGGTNLSDGLFQGMQLIQDRPKGSNEVASVLLFTDGQANQGLCDKGAIVSRMIDTSFISSFKPSESSSRGSFQMQQQQQMQQRPQMQQVQTPPPRSKSFLGSLSSMFASLKPQPTTQTPASTSGSTTSSARADKSSEFSDVPSQYTVNTFGFGTNHNADLLKGIADAGNGLYFFIQNADMVADAFVDCVGGLLSVVGQNLRLQVSAPAGSGVELCDVLTTYPKTVGNNSTEVAIRDMQSEETRDLICTVSLPKLGAPSTQQPVLEFQLVYDNCVSNARDTIACTARLDRPNPTDPLLETITPNLELTEQLNRTLTADALAESTKLGNAGELAKGRELLQKTIERLQASPTAAHEMTSSLVESMKEALKGMKEQRSWQSMGSKVNANMSTGYHQQRSNPYSEQMGMKGYSNLKKSKMKKAFHK